MPRVKMLPKRAGSVRCMHCGAHASADGKGSPIILKHERNCRENANLGLATTEMLLEEIAVRAEVASIDREGAVGRIYTVVLAQDMRVLLRTLPRDVLDYRTVDSE